MADSNSAPTGVPIILSQLAQVITQPLNASYITDPSTQFYWDPAQGGNGHIYQFVSIPVGSVVWTDLSAIASSMTFGGFSGYLATITSPDENMKVFSQFGSLFYSNPAAIGASDAGSEGAWYWTGGPEAGQRLSFTNWAPGEPNNGWYGPSDPNGQNYLVFNPGNILPEKTSKWDDFWNSNMDTAGLSGAIVEFSGAVVGNSPALIASGAAFTEKKVLYADGSQIADADIIGGITWQWQRSADRGQTWINIFNAKGSTYSLGMDDVGGLVRAMATYTDGGGAQETVVGQASSTVLPSAGVNLIIGTSASDTLVGTNGSDLINGLRNADRLDGGECSDIYFIMSSREHTSSEISDTGNAGIDEVRFTAVKSDTLKIFAGDTGIERVVIGTGIDITADTSGTLALNIDASKAQNGLILIGNAGANKLTGSAFADTIDGGAGADKMAGGAGDDIYIIDSIKDVVSEKSKGGMDTIRSAVSYSLPSNVENLALIGSLNSTGKGNGLDNTILGNVGDNMLIGGLGNDTLTGGAGSDSFVFNSKPNAATNVDVIFDFSGDEGDHIQFSLKTFKGLTAIGSVSSDQFWSGPSVTAAHDATDRLLYNTTTGDLFYDADGTGAKAAAVLVAHLSGAPSLAVSDLQIVA